MRGAGKILMKASEDAFKSTQIIKKDEPLPKKIISLEKIANESKPEIVLEKQTDIFDRL